MLMDLQKIFNRLSRDIMSSKAPHLSTFTEFYILFHLFRDVRQCSILRSLLSDVFIDDIFYLITNGFLYNYAGNSTSAHWHKHFDTLVSTLSRIHNSQSLIQGQFYAGQSIFSDYCFGCKEFCHLN